MVDKLDLMRDYSEGKIASIVVNKHPQLEIKEPQTLEKTGIMEEGGHSVSEAFNEKISDRGKLFNVKCDTRLIQRIK